MYLLTNKYFTIKVGSLLLPQFCVYVSSMKNLVFFTN